MSNWPPTCRACGAPMLGGRCPRCRAEARSLGGKIVASGFSEGGFPGASEFPIQYHAITAAEGAPPDLVIPNVTVPLGATLGVYMVTTNSGSLVDFGSVDWGGDNVPVREVGGDSTAFSALFTLQGSGTKTLTCTNTDPDAQRIGAVVFYLTGSTAYVGAEHAGDTSAGPALVDAIAEGANRLFVVGVFVHADNTDFGTWGANATPRQGLYIDMHPTAPAPVTGWLSNATVEATTSGLFTVTKTLAGSREWFMEALEFR